MKRIPDIACLLGACLLGYGVWLTWPPLAFIFAGAALIAAGVRLHLNHKRTARGQ